MTTNRQVREKLEAYVKRERWSGWDPFDGLNSRLFQSTPFRTRRFARLALLQACKRSPINLRPILGVPRELNNKGLGLFLASISRLYTYTKDERYRSNALELVELLRAGVSPGYSGACWGYNFDWQARAFFQPKGTPTVVATHFIANALLDARESFGWDELLDLATSSCNFVLSDLNRTVDGETQCFSYSPEDSSQVYNASALGMQLLARVGYLTDNRHLLDEARRAAEYLVARQRQDGAWVYGNLPYHNWVDSFHTGFVLDCLDDYANYSGDEDFTSNIQLGLRYYKEKFFLVDGTPKYYDQKIYPIDAHSAGQALLTLTRFGEVALAEKVATWTIKNMFDSKGYFYYQKTPSYTNKIPYMRWVQAWMLRGLIELEVKGQPRHGQLAIDGVS